jgi:hypothetical protein
MGKKTKESSKKSTKKTRCMMRCMMLVLAFVILILPVVAVAENTATAAPAYTFDLSPIVQAVFALLAALITYKLVPWIKSKTTAQQQQVLDAAINVAVYAAEQLYGAGRGEEKLDYALKYLTAKGYNIGSQTVKNGVEAAVKALSFQQATTDALVGIPLSTDTSGE